MKQFARFLAGACVLAALAVLVYSAAATGGDKELKVSDKAPIFESVDENGKPWKSSDVVGKKIIVLYFYPAEFNGG